MPSTPITPSKQESATQGNKRNWLKIIIALVCAAVIVTTALLAYFLTRNHTNIASSTTDSDNAQIKTVSVSSSSITTVTTSISATATKTASGSTTTKKSSKLYGYYGQNALANGVDIKNGTNSRVTVTSDYQRSLAYYCQTGFYDVINLAFLNIFGGGKNTFTITFASFNVTTAYGGHYTYNGDGLESNSADVVQGYASIGLDIITCQALGVKVILSIGGDRVSPYTFVVGDGAAYATLFYDMFLDGKSAVRPFGEGVVLNGIEMDVEKNDDPTVWTPEMISFLQNLKKLSPNSLVAVVPQCYLGSAGKDENVGDVIAAAASSIDYLIIQYYNNPVCSYPFGFNFVTWKTLFTGPLVIGLAGDWTSAISGGFLDASALQTVYDLVKSDDQFAGFSVYDVSSSNPPAFAWSFVDYADPPLSEYSQTLRNVLDGKGSGGVSLASLGPAPLENTATAYRCGGTWVDANSTCSNAVCSDTMPVLSMAQTQSVGHCPQYTVSAAQLSVTLDTMKQNFQ